MQDRPEASVLLEAIADFLMKEVLPAVKHSDALAYKTLVSWNMLGVVSREIKDAEGLLNNELERLANYLGKELSLPDTAKEKARLAAELNGFLAEKIRTEKLTPSDSQVLAVVKQGLLEKLQIANPRFGTD